MEWKNGDLVIELAGNNNQNFAFAPLAMVLRGRWRPGLVRETSSNTEFSRLPDIPGIYLVLSASERAFRAIDPIGLPENASKLDEINRIISPWIGKRSANETIERTNLSDTEIKTFLFNMVQMVQSQDAVVVFGKVPAMPDVLALPGQLQVRHFYVNNEQPKYASPDEIERMGGPRVADTEPRRRQTASAV